MERIEKGKRKRDELLAELERRKRVNKPELISPSIFHLEMLEEIERIEEGEGREMEWERIEWKLVKGNGGGSLGKRKRGKKLRWTPEAIGYAKLKGLMARRCLKAGRRLEG